jgi:ferric-dicitrate binding protein FerR (iron transport regulator)
MTTDNNFIQELTRYLTGEANQIDKKKLDNWLQQDSRNQIVFEELQNIWFALNASEERKMFETEKAWNKYSNWIDQQANGKHHRFSFHFLKRASKYAAAIVISVLLTVVYYQVGRYTNKGQTYTTNIPIGQKGSVTLSDGTIVQLNGGSQLVSQIFEGKKERQVSLNGEAYFKVAHMDNKPFIVNVNDISVKVYGTEFNIHGYKEDHFTQTTLIKGSVGVTISDGTEYMLKPNEIIQVSRNGEVNLLKNQALTQQVSWLNDKYKFKDETLSKILKQIERMYGVKIQMDDPKIRQELYTGQFSRNESIESVLQRFIMSSPFRLDYKINNKEITIFTK